MKGMMYRTIALGLKWSTFRSAYKFFFSFFSLYLYFSNLKSNIPVTSVCVDVDAQEESHCHLWAPLQRGRDGGKEGRASGQASGARWQKRAQPSRDEGHAGEGLLWNLVSVHVREFLSFFLNKQTLARLWTSWSTSHLVEHGPCMGGVQTLTLMWLTFKGFSEILG